MKPYLLTLVLVIPACSEVVVEQPCDSPVTAAPAAPQEGLEACRAAVTPIGGFRVCLYAPGELGETERLGIRIEGPGDTFGDCAAADSESPATCPTGTTGARLITPYVLAGADAVSLCTPWACAGEVYVFDHGTLVTNFVDVPEAPWSYDYEELAARLLLEL